MALGHLMVISVVSGKITITLPYHRRELLPKSSVPFSLLQSENHKNNVCFPKPICCLSGVVFGEVWGPEKYARKLYDGMGRSSS